MLVARLRIEEARRKEPEGPYRDDTRERAVACCAREILEVSRRTRPDGPRRPKPRERKLLKKSKWRSSRIKRRPRPGPSAAQTEGGRGVALQPDGKTRCCSEGSRSRKTLGSHFGDARAIGPFSVVEIPGNVSRTCELVRVDSGENVTSDVAHGGGATSSPRAPPLSRDPLSSTTFA